MLRAVLLDRQASSPGRPPCQHCRSFKTASSAHIVCVTSTYQCFVLLKPDLGASNRRHQLCRSGTAYQAQGHPHSPLPMHLVAETIAVTNLNRSANLNQLKTPDVPSQFPKLHEHTVHLAFSANGVARNWKRPKAHAFTRNT